jgi:hypothetical protein
MEIPASSITGFDPLEDAHSAAPEMEAVMADATKRVVVNILKSYTGHFDVFSELIQNALDAVEKRYRNEGSGFRPRVYITLDMKNSRLSVTDNGVGMTLPEFKFCFRPNVSFKKDQNLRGQKGVGATFIAYGFSHVTLQTKVDDFQIAATLAQGRAWAEDATGQVLRPRLEEVSFGIPELSGERRGTSVEVWIGHHPAERPKLLSWWGARTPDQWYDLLRSKTPLGQVHLHTAEFHPSVQITVIDPTGELLRKDYNNPEYYYPHDMPLVQKVQSLNDIQVAERTIEGSAPLVFQKMKSEFKRLQCVYEVWDHNQILSGESLLGSEFSEEERYFIERHKVAVYGCFLHSAKLWNRLSQEVGLRTGFRLLSSGVHLASDRMIQGEPLIIPLSRTQGYASNAHVIVHFTDGSPDLGRKTFQPELTDLAERLSTRAVAAFLKYRAYLERDTGATDGNLGSDLWDWKVQQVERSKKNPLNLVIDNRKIPIVSEPQQEQDVVALFHEMLVGRVIRGIDILCTNSHERYDSLFYADYRNPDMEYGDKNPLGVSSGLIGKTSAPSVLEYKYDLMSLIEDIEKEEKRASDIDLAVCWDVDREELGSYILKPLLIYDEGATRNYFGATHKVFVETESEVKFEVIILKHLVGFLQNPEDEKARQVARFS